MGRFAQQNNTIVMLSVFFSLEDKDIYIEDGNVYNYSQILIK